MPKRRWLGLVTAMFIGGASVVVSTEPASATVVVPINQSGHTCSSYKYITNVVYWQVCAWASGGSYPRVWFTAHFGNRGSSAFTVDQIEMDYIRNGVRHNCPWQYERFLTIPANGTQATSDMCWLTRPWAGGAFAASIAVRQPNLNYAVRQSSPTLQVQGY